LPNNRDLLEDTHLSKGLSQIQETLSAGVEASIPHDSQTSLLKEMAKLLEHKFRGSVVCVTETEVGLRFAVDWQNIRVGSIDPFSKVFYTDTLPFTEKNRGRCIEQSKAIAKLRMKMETEAELYEHPTRIARNVFSKTYVFVFRNHYKKRTLLRLADISNKLSLIEKDYVMSKIALEQEENTERPFVILQEFIFSFLRDNFGYTLCTPTESGLTDVCENMRKNEMERKFIDSLNFDGTEMENLTAKETVNPNKGRWGFYDKL